MVRNISQSGARPWRSHTPVGTARNAFTLVDRDVITSCTRIAVRSGTSRNASALHSCSNARDVNDHSYRIARHDANCAIRRRRRQRQMVIASNSDHEAKRDRRRCCNKPPAGPVDGARPQRGRFAPDAPGETPPRLSPIVVPDFGMTAGADRHILLALPQIGHRIGDARHRQAALPQLLTGFARHRRRADKRPSRR